MSKTAQLARAYAAVDYKAPTGSLLRAYPKHFERKFDDFLT